MYTKKKDFFAPNGTDLIFTVNVTTSFTIPTQSGSYTYLYNVDWGDSNIDVNQTGNILHNYGSPGTYQIKVSGLFPKFYFNNTGDKDLLISIDQWGDVGYTLGDGTFSTTGQYKAFHGCTNLVSIANDCQWMNSLLCAYQMFSSCTSLVGLPNNLTLNALKIGGYMFSSTTFTSLNNVRLNALTNGSNMFQNGSLTSLPSDLTMPLLNNAYFMFTNCSITNFPIGFLMNSVTTAQSCFQGNNFIQNPPAGMTLAALTNGIGMFNNSGITGVPSTMTLASLTNGTSMFASCTLSTSSYSQLIINIEANNPNNTITFHGGASSTYNSTAYTAHDNLTITRGWTITDGGPV